MRVVITCVALLLAGCSVPKKEFVNNLITQDYGGEILTVLPNIPMCFGISYNDAKTSLNIAMIDAIEANPIEGESVTRDYSSKYGKMVGEKAFTAFAKKHSGTFLSQNDECRKYFAADVALAKK